jgi:hypothetical protein
MRLLIFGRELKVLKLIAKMSVTTIAMGGRRAVELPQAPRLLRDLSQPQPLIG